MATYIKRPILIEAMRVPEEKDRAPFREWSETVGLRFSDDADGNIVVQTIEGPMGARPGEWVMRNANGDFYPMTDENFTGAYVPADKFAEHLTRDPQPAARVKGR
jgi:hypothetical protein